MLTYNQIIKIIQDFATNHFQINEFGNGDLWEVVESNQLTGFNYPLLWVQDDGATTSANRITHSFKVLCMDLVHKDESNENEVKSDTQLILYDLSAYLDKSITSQMVIERTSSMVSFTERFGDEVTGWAMTIKISQPFTYDRCSVPMTPTSSTPTICADGTVKNSDSTYTDTVASGGTLVLPDITHKDTDGSDVILPAQTPMICTAVGQSGIAYNRPLPTGQNVIYATDDDAWNAINNPYPDAPAFPTHYPKLDYTAGTPFINLINNNVFGNTDRFTDELGLQDYTNDLVIDHLTGLMWYRIAPGADWATAVANADASTQGGFSDWRVPNSSELYSISDRRVSNVLGYVPFGLTSINLWTSTTLPSTTTNAYRMTSLGVMGATPKTNTVNYLMVRHMY